MVTMNSHYTEQTGVNIVPKFSFDQVHQHKVKYIRPKFTFSVGYSSL